MPWDETFIARLYDKIDETIEDGGLAGIVSAVPISFDKENGTIKVEVTLDLSDIFEEEDIDSEDEGE